MSATTKRKDKPTLQSASAGPLYEIADGADRDDIQSSLSAKLSQLHAMLMTCYGGCYESFSCCSKETQNNYLWACSDLAEECRFLAEQL